MDETDVKEYTQRAAKLRSEGRSEESLLVARKAVSLAPEDANAWWQLALAQRDKDDIESALPALEKVVELAPSFAAGWHELGRAHHHAKRLDLAIEAYDRALEADNGYIPSMRMLAYALKGKNEDGVAARRLGLLRAIFEKDELDDEDTFDLAYLLGEAKETAEAVKVYEHYTREHRGPGAFYNLALGYRSLGRDADALDALEAARRSGYDTENLKSVLSDTQRRLQALRQQVVRKPPPYLPKEEWFQHYINPFTLLNVEPNEVADNPKALQKAKQALLREIELEDGRVDWVPGLVIDKSAAMARLTELDNPDAWRAHQLVHESRGLGEFLMKGSLEHFLIKEDGTSDVVLPHLLEEEVLKLIGPKFAAQYDKVLSHAAEKEDLSAVECLMDGRRWVLPSQQEACFDSTKRLLTRLREPLMKLGEAAKARAVSRTEVEAAFNRNSLRGLLTHLPIEFYEAHSEVGIALRGLSVDFYNREHDAEGAKAILSLGRICAQKSPALAHQMEADEKLLDKFIAEEKSKEARLSFKDRDLTITKTGVVYGDQKLVPADITGVRWGLVQTAVQPSTVRHTIAFRSRRGRDIEVSWTTSRNLEEQNKYWSSLVDATIAFIVDPVFEEFTSGLDNRLAQTRVGPLEVRKEGVVFTIKGWFSDKQVLVPWQQVSSTMSNGSLVLSGVTNSKAKAVLPLESTYNAIFLHMLANRKESGKS
jgi:tetratricopeptide (TPR) repeat protein